MIFGLCRGQPRNRGQNAECVTGEHDHVLGVAAQPVAGGVGDVIERIGAPHVLGQAAVFEIQRLGLFVEDHVLDHGAEHAGGGKDFRLCLGVQPDRLGIAAAFEIEGAAIRPAMFVVADQGAVGIGRQGGLAGARQAKEHGGIHRVAIGVVGRTVHRHDALFWQQVVEHAKDGFLVFARVFGVADQDQLLVEIHRDHGFGAAAVARRVGLEAGAVDDCEIRGEAVQLVLAGTAQQVADEQVVPGQFVNHTHVQAVRGIGPGEQILHEIGAALHVLQHVGVQAIKGVGLHRGVVVPPDGIFGGLGAHGELVLGRTAGKFTGADQEGAAIAQRAFAVLQRGLDQGGLHKIVIDIAQPLDPLIFEAELRVYPSKCHRQTPVADLN